jgi:hypothetical protein
MRTLVAVVTTSILTALAVHIVDANAAGTTVEAEKFVVRDAQGNVRVAIDEHGMSVIDQSNRTRIGIRVDDDGVVPNAPFGRATIAVSAFDAFYTTLPNGLPNPGEVVALTDGVASSYGPDPHRVFEPSVQIFRASSLGADPMTTTYGTVVGAGRIKLLGQRWPGYAQPLVDRVTLDSGADGKGIVLRDTNNRVRFRK